MNEESKVKLMDLPTTVRGYCFHDDDGEEFIVLNSRLTWEQNQITYDHERRHIRRGEMYNGKYKEYGGGTK